LHFYRLSLLLNHSSALNWFLNTARHGTAQPKVISSFLHGRSHQNFLKFDRSIVVSRIYKLKITLLLLLLLPSFVVAAEEPPFPGDRWFHVLMEVLQCPVVSEDPFRRDCGEYFSVDPDYQSPHVIRGVNDDGTPRRVRGLSRWCEQYGGDTTYRNHSFAGWVNQEQRKRWHMRAMRSGHRAQHRYKHLRPNRAGHSFR